MKRSIQSHAIRTFADALGAARQAGDAWGALHVLFAAALGARLFTVTTVDVARAEARRLYTSHPDDYPVSGAKPLFVDRWYAQVVDRHETFVLNSLAEIAEHFPDHETIGALGCGSVVNLPVILGGSVVATVNCLDREGAYGASEVEVCEQLRPHALAAYLVAQRAR